MADETAQPTSRRDLLKGAGGRQTQPTNFNPFGGMPYAFVSRRLLSGMDLSRYRPEDFAPWQLMQILADSHTDVGLALWNVLRLGTTGFTVSVKTLSGQDDPEGTAAATAVVAGLNPKSGGAEALFVQWMLSWYLYGAVCGELALTDDLSGVLDVFAVNPFTIYFRRDAVTQELVMYQQQVYRPQADRTGAARGGTDTASASGRDAAFTSAGGFRRLNDALCFYTPCDPAIDDPYGRIPSGTVISEVFFDVGFLYDLQKIVHGVGAPKYTVKIIEEILKKSCPPAIANNHEKYNGWLDARLAEVQAAFNGLAPDEAFVGYDSVEIDVVSAKSGTNIMGLADALSRVIERRIIKALKMLPILMASNESTTETHGSVQFEIFAAGIQSAQASISAMMAQMLKLALQLQGRQCLVECGFPSIKTANRLLSANAENKELINELLKWAAGFQDQNAASVAITGSPAVAPPLPGFLESLAPQNKPASAEAPASEGRAGPTPEETESAMRRLFNTLFDERSAAGV